MNALLTTPNTALALIVHNVPIVGRCESDGGLEAALRGLWHRSPHPRGPDVQPGPDRRRCVDGGLR